MAKVRSREECLAAIQSDSAWRKKEIALFKSSIVEVGQADNTPLLRSAVVMLYAHWEGFIKTACDLYLQHINEVINRRSVVLADHFQLILIWKEYRKRGDHPFLKNPMPFVEAVQGYYNQNSDRILLPVDMIDAEANPNFKVLTKLLRIVDIDTSDFITKENLIDEKLLKMRNAIAHGDRMNVSIDQYTEIEGQIKGLFDIFQNLIEGCVQNEKYRHPSARYLNLP